MILAGDVGGTKVHLALYDFTNGRLTYKREERFPAKDYSGLEAIVKEFLSADTATAACFGVPGPVRDGRLRLTNLPWTLDSRELSTALGIQHVFLINDLEANGYGIAELAPDQIHTLSEGDASQIGNRALIAAGTGLGEGLLTWNGRIHVPYPSEGGHVDYAPRNEDEIDLLRFLKQKYNGRISFERVVSGMGLTSIYEFLREVRGVEEPAWLAEQLAIRTPSSRSWRCRPRAKSAKKRWICLFRRMARRPATWRSRCFQSVVYTSAAASPRASSKSSRTAPS
jgi:glucokinase